MKLKVRDDGTPVMAGGLPVYIHDDGSSSPFDAGAAVQRTKTLHAELMSERIGNYFHLSKLVADKLSVPADIVSAKFGGNFKLEGGSIVGYDDKGEKIWSRSNPGTVAGFDEALETLVNAYPHRASILKSNGTPDEARGESNSGTASSKTLTRATFDPLPPVAKQAHFKNGGTIVDG